MQALQLRSRLCLSVSAVPGASAVTDVVEQALRGGVGLVECTLEEGGTSRQVAQAVQLAWLCRRVGVPLVVGGRVDIALAALADGVCLRRDDMPPALARRLMGPRALIGMDCASVAEAREAERQGASYVRLGPVFATPDATMPAPLLHTVARGTRLPVAAVGGVTPANIASLRDSLASVICADVAIASAADPQAVTQGLLTALNAPDLPPAVAGTATAPRLRPLDQFSR